jgi:two-component system response regulator YesN
VAKQYIAEHYREQIKLEDVARQVHLNPVYFSTIFKKETGMNFSDYLINYRLDVAKDLLKTTGLSMAEIAGAVGYLDTKYFSKLFTKVVGIKPSEYRKLYS